jgi:hypothetical protein
MPYEQQQLERVIADLRIRGADEVPLSRPPRRHESYAQGIAPFNALCSCEDFRGPAERSAGFGDDVNPLH